MASCCRNTIFNVILTVIWLSLYIGSAPSHTVNAYNEIKQWHHDVPADITNTETLDASKNDEKRNSFNDKLRGLRRLSRLIGDLRYESAMRPAKKSPEVVDELDNANGNGDHNVNQNSGAFNREAVPIVTSGLRDVASAPGMAEQIQQTPAYLQAEWKLQRIPDTTSRGTAPVDDKETNVPKRSAGVDSLGLDVFRQKSRESRRRWGGKPSRPQPFGIGLFGKRGAETLGMVDTGDLVDIIADMLHGNQQGQTN